MTSAGIGTNDSIVIAGGGIAGLTTALSLSHFGYDSIVIERDQFRDQVGSGIQLSPNATRVLFKLKLKESLLSYANRPSHLITRNWRTGRTTSIFPINTHDKWDASIPYLHVHRGELIEILASAAKLDPRITMRSNEEVVDCSETEYSAVVRTDQIEFRCPILIACDGTHSRIRYLLDSREKIQKSRWTAWRTILATPFESMNSVQLWLGPRVHVVTYPVSQAKFLNVVCIARIDTAFSDAWRAKGSVKELEALLRAWHPDITSLVSSIDPDRLFRWGIVPHQPTSATPQRNRILLLGDAWHTILPFLAQGAALAIEDAYSFAHRLAMSQRDYANAVTMFHRDRYRRINQVRQLSASLGHVYSFGQPWATLRDLMSPIASRFIQKRIYDFDATV